MVNNFFVLQLFQFCLYYNQNGNTFPIFCMTSRHYFFKFSHQLKQGHSRLFSSSSEKWYWIQIYIKSFVSLWLDVFKKLLHRKRNRMNTSAIIFRQCTKTQRLETFGLSQMCLENMFRKQVFSMN